MKHATGSEVKLLIHKVGSFGGVDERLYSDGMLEIFWNGAPTPFAAAMTRQTVASGFSSEGLAIDALRSSYPKVGR